jgi:hypothetical protein
LGDQKQEGTLGGGCISIINALKPFFVFTGSADGKTDLSKAVL